MAVLINILVFADTTTLWNDATRRVVESGDLALQPKTMEHQLITCKNNLLTTNSDLRISRWLHFIILHTSICLPILPPEPEQGVIAPEEEI